ncbi:hypothetical protein CUC08_Gglean007698 [Alternaria sp. MG1]|nr:hypothetical protein CUC08_Gglean007698 [Alternaria sp. MG1]
MYFSKIAALAAATMASTVVADNCFAGYAYCSGNLLTQGSSPLLLVTSPFPLLPSSPSPSSHSLLCTIPTNTPLGDYASTIYQTLDSAGQPTDANAQAKALFNCVNNGAIQFIRLCEGNCVNEPFGSQVSDHC